MGELEDKADEKAEEHHGHDEPSMSQLRSQMIATMNPKTDAKEKDVFPYFETLLRVEKGASLPRYVTIIISRSPQPTASHNGITGVLKN